MKYFRIETVRSAIERLQEVSANWLLPAFVFASNGVDEDDFTDMSTVLGTDQFLDRYFNGARLNIPPFESGNNLLRPRLKGIRWDRGDFAGDHMIRQDTKMWGNLFSSRGYREMRLEGLIEGEKSVLKLTDAFQPRFEAEVPASFHFEDLLVWLFAFEGFPDHVGSWADLYRHLLEDGLERDAFPEPYLGRFSLSEPAIDWPETIEDRPGDDEYLEQLAPKLLVYLRNGDAEPEEAEEVNGLEDLADDDAVLAEIQGAIARQDSYSFLLAGPPGTGKTRYARRLSIKLANSDPEKVLFLQFHPAIGYDDFIEGFRPVPDDSQTGFQYKLEPRTFLEFSREASNNPDRRYVVVIDELNRGDVARIFGELLTYLEPDYRGQEFSLSYSGQRESIPENLIILATANPFDRSVTDLDDALLRRFWVIELEPDGPLLRSHLKRAGVEDSVLNRTARMFEILNDALPSGFGHTTFLNVRSIEDLAAIWNGRVRLGLKRAFLHDRSSYDTVSGEIEGLLSTRQDDEEEPENGQGEPQG